MLVHKGGQIKNWSGECKDIIPTKLQCQTIQRTLKSPNLPLQIWTLKICNHDISKTITARSSKLGQLIEDDE